MAEYTGKDLVASFVHSGGTVGLNADYRSMSSSPTIDLVEASAGNDTDKTWLIALKDGDYSWQGVAQSAGTVLRDALVEGTQGTLIIQPEGTASGKPKETVPVIVTGAVYNFVYNNLVEISTTFKKNGARTLGSN